MNVKNGDNRLLEMIPGATVWLTLILAIVLSIFKPLLAIYIIIIFDLYWLFRVLYFIVYVIYSWCQYKKALKTDWKKDLESKSYQKIYHLIFLPFYRESFEIIDATLNNILQSQYPADFRDNYIIVLAGEERTKAHYDDIVPRLTKKYSDKFFKLVTTLHPAGVVGEIAGKGSNINYAGREVKKVIDGLKIPYENIIVSSFDVDTVVHPQYFACLTNTYLTHPNPTRTSYQPVALYNNNIWDSPAFMRLSAFGTTFWLMTELARPDRMYTFSSHSMSFKALVDVGFWQNDIVTEDSRIFLQCFMHYDGNYSVTPLYIPVSMDTVMADSFKRSVLNLYNQQRRWAWGVEHFPYMIVNFAHNKKIALGKKIKYIWNLSEGMYSWATAPLLIFILGRLPLFFVTDSEKSSVLVQNAPYILETLLNLAMLGLFFTAALALLLLPARPQNHPPHKFLFMIAQWILFPVTFVVFGAIPAIDAQTRLMLGKYLGFWVTEKSRK